MDRFWNKVDKTGDCWIWLASCNPNGYGQFKLFDHSKGNQKVVEAHRFAWQLVNGPIPEGLCVCHKCDNPKCVNPAHLFLGTCKDNAQDMVQKGRGPKGRFSDHLIRRIRREYAVRLSCYKIAAKYDISPSIVNRIVNGEIYSHVDGPIRERGTYYCPSGSGQKKTGGYLSRRKPKQ